MVREIAQAPPIPPRNYAIPSNFNFNTSEYGGAHGSPLCQNQNHLYESYDQKTNNMYYGAILYHSLNPILVITAMCNQ